MEEFPFHLTLNYKMDNSTEIKVPYSLNLLRQVIIEKYDLIKIPEIYYENEDGYEIKLSDENDYVELINYTSNKNLSVVEIIIKDSEDISKKRK